MEKHFIFLELDGELEKRELFGKKRLLLDFLLDLGLLLIVHLVQDLSLRFLGDFIETVTFLLLLVILGVAHY